MDNNVKASRRAKNFSRALLKKRRLISTSAMLIAVTLIFWVVNSPAIVGVSAVGRKLPIYCVQRDNKAASLSFDAAWGNEDTEQIIDILSRYNVKATFFCGRRLGRKVPGIRETVV